MLSCSPLCNEFSIVETNLARENNELKQEVEKPKKDLVKKKSKVKPFQDNGPPVKKLEKGSTMTLFISHEDGHKSYECKQCKRKEIKKKTSTFNTHTVKINKKKVETSYLLKKEDDDGKVATYVLGVKVNR